MQHMKDLLSYYELDSVRNKRAKCGRRLMYVFSNHISDRSNGISYLII